MSFGLWSVAQLPLVCWTSLAERLSTGGTLVSRGEISVGALTSLLMYTVYVGSGLQMLTYVVLPS